eukprot:GGOE01061122.1.p1 GENE.GGOE01061122.1~~GGOE01061122.1.p1  ORF type:complete len:255 (+),score=43.75 GGOE01061122.1:40-804(+)
MRALLPSVTCPTPDQLAWAWESLAPPARLQVTCLCMAWEQGAAAFQSLLPTPGDDDPSRALIANLVFWLQESPSDEVEDLKYCLLAGHPPVPLPIPPTRCRRTCIEQQRPTDHPLGLPLSDAACPHSAAAVVDAFATAGQHTPLCVALPAGAMYVVRFAQVMEDFREFLLLTDSHGVVRSGSYLGAQFAFGRLAWERRYHHSPQGVCHLRGYPILQFRIRNSDVEVVLPFRTAFESAPPWAQREETDDLSEARK